MSAEQTGLTKIQVHALHKSGSMFLWPFFKVAANKLGVNFYSVNDTPKTEELAFRDESNGESFIVSPLRWYPETIDSGRYYVFVVRNPLDVLVSQYYSHGWIHPDPLDVPEKLGEFRERRNKIQSLTIDEYCVQYADELLKKYINLLSYWDDREHVLVTRYSEMVCDFESWCTRVGKAIGLEETDINELHASFANQFNIVDELTPDQIKQGGKRHKRKMLPGDHLEKLSPAIIGVLNRKFDAVLKLINQIEGSQKTEKTLRDIAYQANRSQVKENAQPQSPKKPERKVRNVKENVEENSEEEDDGVNILRFGTEYGEWYIPDVFDEDSVFYCVGAGEDISFDVLLQNYYKGEVHIFDPTPRAIKHYELVESVMKGDTPAPTNIRYGGGDLKYWQIMKDSSADFQKLYYHDFGISEITADRRFFYPKNEDHVSCSIENIQNTNTAFSAPTKTIKQTMDDNGHKYIDLLKLSVQGSEGKVILNMLQDKVYPTIICLQWDSGVHGVESTDFIKNNYIAPLVQSGYQLIYDNGRLKHTFARVVEEDSTEAETAGTAGTPEIENVD